MKPEPLSITHVMQAFTIWRTASGFERVLGIKGFAPQNLRYLLNNLCKFDGCNYLEVGTLHGASLIAAAYANQGSRFTGVDNFSEFDGNFEKLKANLTDRQLCGDQAPAFVQADSLTIPLAVLPLGVNVFFYDGNHSETDTRETIVRFDPLLADRFVLVVDDYSWIGPKRGAEAAILELGWRVQLKIAIEDNYNKRGWGIGLLVVLAEKGK